MSSASPRWGASQWGAGDDCSSDLRDTVLLAASQYSSSARKPSIMRTKRRGCQIPSCSFVIYDFLASAIAAEGSQTCEYKMAQLSGWFLLCRWGWKWDGQEVGLDRR